MAFLKALLHTFLSSTAIALKAAGRWVMIRISLARIEGNIPTGTQPIGRFCASTFLRIASGVRVNRGVGQNVDMKVQLVEYVIVLMMAMRTRGREKPITGMC